MLISLFESSSASDKPWKVDGMNYFLEKVEFTSPCLVPSLYCSVSELKCFISHIISHGSPRLLSMLDIGMVTFYPGYQLVVKSYCFWKPSFLPILIYFIINISIMIVFLSENEIFFQFNFNILINIVVWHNICWYYILFATKLSIWRHIQVYFPRLLRFLYTYRNLKSFRQMLHYVPFF